MSGEVKTLTESQSTLSSLEGGGSRPKASDKDHDLSRSLDLLKLSTEPQQVASTSPRSCSSSGKTQLFPRNSAPDNTGPLDTLLYSTKSTDPKENRVTFGNLTALLYNPVVKFVKKFRQSNSYPPIGTSLDLKSFDLISFIRELEKFIHEKGAVDEDENDENKVGMEPVPSGLCFLVYQTVYVVLLRTLLSSDTDEEVYEFWENFVLDAASKSV